MEAMNPIPVRSATESLGIAPQTVTREPRRSRIGRYAGRGRAGRSLRSPEARRTASCCIRSKSSRSQAHPFREGNGRAQRLFWDRVACDAGWQLSWLEVTGEINVAACRAAAEERDLEPLITMLDQVVSRR